MTRTVLLITISIMVKSFIGCSPKWEETETNDGYNLIKNKGGSTLGYSPNSGVSILIVDGYAFKDLNRNGKLEIFEDWRKSSEERAKDLASKMSLEQIAGLMLYSSHQAIPGGNYGQWGKYNGKKYEDANVPPFTISDEQRKFLIEDNLRHVLITSVESPAIAAKWNNNIQALIEGVGFGIPANNSTDPRHGAPSDVEFFAGAGGNISRWTSSLGMAATFDAELVKEFGMIASKEYRALGIATALSPQIDLATDPRWWRVSGTFGESPELSTHMAKAYCEGFQYSTAEQVIEEGWGHESVNAMVKHWPGGGTGEGGRDAHIGAGKYGIFPGNNLKEHMKPFVEGAFNLGNDTKMASAVMPYYTISYNQDPSGKNVGNGFSKFLIQDQFRGRYKYDGVVCTDWQITDGSNSLFESSGRPWGLDSLTNAERHYEVIMAGTDQFGGNDKSAPIIEAYKIGVKEHGQEFMRQRMELSAVRLLKNIFRVGLFENPYLSPDESASLVGNPEFMKKGFESQLKSFVLLKNKNNVLPLKKRTKVFIPTINKPTLGFLGSNELTTVDGINKEIASKYYELVDTPEEADASLVLINSPYNFSVQSGFDETDKEKGGNGYIPISLQYKEYTAEQAREKSIAHDSNESELNRSYKGKISVVKNYNDLDVVLETKKAMGNKPVIVIIDCMNPMIVAEFESKIEGLLISFNCQDQALLDILSGEHEPSAMLPFQLPANMKTVEEQLEDVPFDMECHEDSEGNKYDFAFGLNWSGQIKDDRYYKYKAN